MTRIQLTPSLALTNVSKENQIERSSLQKLANTFHFRKIICFIQNLTLKKLCFSPIAKSVSQYLYAIEFFP